MNEIDLLREWQYLPIFEYTFRASTSLKNPPQVERLNTTSPIDQELLQIGNCESEFDSGEVTTIVKHNYLTKVVAKKRTQRNGLLRVSKPCMGV